MFQALLYSAWSTWVEGEGWIGGWGKRVGRRLGGSVGGMSSDSVSLPPPAAAAVGASSGSGVGAPSDACGGRAAPAAALSGAGGAAPAERSTLAAIQRTYPKLTLASCRELEQRVKDGHWPEVDEQVRRSEDFRALQPGATMSSVLVSCSATRSTLLDDIIDAVLELLVEFQVQDPARCPDVLHLRLLFCCP